MSYANRKQMSTNRTAAIIIGAHPHCLRLCSVTGLAYNVIKKAAEDLKTFDVEEEPPPPPEEPPPRPTRRPAAAADRGAAVDAEDLRPAPAITTTPVIQQPVITPTARPAPTTRCPGRNTWELSRACPPVVSKAARAKANLNSLFSTDDYPQSAIRNEEQGTTAACLGVGTDGRVTDCASRRRPARPRSTPPPATSSAAGRHAGAGPGRQSHRRQRHCPDPLCFRKNNSR